jgi:hypothetical protein
MFCVNLYRQKNKVWIYLRKLFPFFGGILMRHPVALLIISPDWYTTKPGKSLAW